MNKKLWKLILDKATPEQQAYFKELCAKNELYARGIREVILSEKAIELFNQIKKGSIK